MSRCKRCVVLDANDPLGSTRECAFVMVSRDAGAQIFNGENWNCGTVTALIDAHDPDRRSVVYGSDESLDLIPCDPDNDSGWIIVTRYKRRGKASSLVHVGDWHPAKSVTLALVERTITYLNERRTDAGDRAKDIATATADDRLLNRESEI